MLDVIGDVLTYVFLGAILSPLLLFIIEAIVEIKNGSFSRSRTGRRTRRTRNRKRTQNALARTDDDWWNWRDRASLAHPHYYEILGGEVTKSPFDDDNGSDYWEATSSNPLYHDILTGKFDD